MSLPMDEGYYTQVWYRDATEQEAKDLAAEEADRKSAEESKDLAAKKALEAAETTARASLEGLTKSDSLTAPKGTRTQVGSTRTASVTTSQSPRSNSRMDRWSITNWSRCTMTLESTFGEPTKF